MSSMQRRRTYGKGRTTSRRGRPHDTTVQRVFGTLRREFFQKREGCSTGSVHAMRDDHVQRVRRFEEQVCVYGNERQQSFLTEAIGGMQRVRREGVFQHRPALLLVHGSMSTAFRPFVVRQSATAGAPKGQPQIVLQNLRPRGEATREAIEAADQKQQGSLQMC